jgi:hypothetical protein
VDTNGHPVTGVAVEIISASSTGRYAGPVDGGLTDHEGRFIPTVFPLWLQPALWIRARVDGDWFTRFASQIDAVATHARRPGTAHVVTVPVVRRP